MLSIQWVCHKECTKYTNMGHWASRDDNLDSLFDCQLSDVNQVPYYPMEGHSLPSNRNKISLKSIYYLAILSLHFPQLSREMWNVSLIQSPLPDRQCSNNLFNAYVQQECYRCPWSQREMYGVGECRKSGKGKKIVSISGLSQEWVTSWKFQVVERLIYHIALVTCTSEYDNKVCICHTVHLLSMVKGQVLIFIFT